VSPGFTKVTREHRIKRTDTPRGPKSGTAKTKASTNRLKEQEKTKPTLVKKRPGNFLLSLPRRIFKAPERNGRIPT